MSQLPDPFPDDDYRRLADFRYALRRFLQFSERAALNEGLSPDQHQALLTIRGQKSGTATLNVVAERLCKSAEETSKLIDEMVENGWLVAQTAHSSVETLRYELTEKSALRLVRLSVAHRRELQDRGPQFLELVGSLGK